MRWRLVVFGLAMLAALSIASTGPPGPMPGSPSGVEVQSFGLPLWPQSAATSPAAAQAPPARAPGVHAIDLDVGGGRATGLLAVPDGEPKALVVVAHGWGGDAAGHQPDLEALAGMGALAAAMDFRGERSAFKVQAGVEDTLAVTRALQAEYPAVARTMLFGYSMGAEVALLAAMQAPGTYDYVFAGSGVADLEAFWSSSPLAQPAIEEETGGSPARVPEAYAQRSPVLHATALAGAGVQRVFLLHAAADAVVPVEQAERMYRALADAGQPVSFYVMAKGRVHECAAGLCLTVPTAANHEAGLFAFMRPFIEHRVAGLPDPAERVVRGTYDGHTGAYEPSDVGP